MPTVPNLEAPQVQEEPLPGRAYPRVQDSASPAAFGAPVAEGLEAVGAAGSQEMARQKAQHDQLRVIDANTQLEAARDAILYGKINAETGQREGGAFSFHGMDAINLPAKILPEYQKLSNQISSTLTPDQQRIFQGHIAAGQNELDLQLNRYEYEEGNRLAKETYTNALAQAVNSGSLGYRDPQQIGKSRADIKALVQMQGNREGWDQDQRDHMTRTALEQMHTNVIDRMLADENPQQAMKYLKDVEGELDGTQAFRLERTIQGQLKEAQNEQKQDIADRYQDSLRAAEAGLTSPITVKRSEMDILYPKDSQRRWDELQIMSRAGAQAKAFDSMTPQEIEDALKSSRPQEGGAEALYHLEAQQIMQRAAVQSISKRNSDPAQFAIDRSSWNPLNWANGNEALQELEARSRTQEELSSQIGMPVPLLSKPEAKQLAARMNAAKPSDTVAMLAQLRNTLLNDDTAYESVLSQVSNHSPTLAVVGASLEQPPKNNAPFWYSGKFGFDPQVAEGIVDGQRILSGKGDEKAKGGFQIPPDEDTGSKAGLLTVFRNATGGQHGTLFARRPDSAEVYFDSFKAYYAHLAAEKGVMSGAVNTTLAAQAARAVVGNQTRFNHTDVAIPRGMDPTQFEDLAIRAIQESAQAAGVEPAIAKALSEKAGLIEDGRTLGTGRYLVVDGNGRAIQSTKNGPALRIDLSQLRPQVKKPEFEIRSNPNLPYTPSEIGE